MEQTLLDTLHLFTLEGQRMESRLAGSGLELMLTLKIPGRYDSGGPAVTLSAEFWDGKTHQRVEGANLGALMDECYRRAGYADRTAAAVDRVAATLTALPSPEGNGAE